MTVVVLNYNYERYLRSSLDSALTQQYDDVEVVVVDDGSGDGSADLIRTYGDRVVPVLKENGGQGSAMNAGFAVSTGDVVLFLDADDALERDAAGQVAAVFAQQPDTAWVMWRLRVIDGDGRPTSRVRPRRPGVMPDGDLREHLARYRCFHWQPTSGNAFAASALRQVLPMPDAEYRISADAYLAAVVPLCGPVRSLDAVLGSYRIHGRSSFTSCAVDDAYFRGQIARAVDNHRHAVRVARTRGVALPADERTPRDAAFLGFRMASLLLAQAEHPYADDTRRRLAREGVVAALANPELGWPNRLRRAAWFAACGLLPAARAARLAAGSAPDTPARRAKQAARAAARR